MKKITKSAAILVLCVMLGTGSPVIAQNPDSTTTTRSYDHDDDTGKWGLLGLVGLLGLLGLRKREYENKRRSDVNR